VDGGDLRLCRVRPPHDLPVGDGRQVAYHQHALARSNRAINPPPNELPVVNGVPSRPAVRDIRRRTHEVASAWKDGIGVRPVVALVGVAIARVGVSSVQLGIRLDLDPAVVQVAIADIHVCELQARILLRVPVWQAGVVGLSILARRRVIDRRIVSTG
jgi:hypothetical protein